MHTESLLPVQQQIDILRHAIAELNDELKHLRFDFDVMETRRKKEQFKW